MESVWSVSKLSTESAGTVKKSARGEIVTANIRPGGGIVPVNIRRGRLFFLGGGRSYNSTPAVVVS